ncbi:hypothetical protein AHAS_Ahas17G0256700 [Arachis hypogaea]
MIVTNIKNKKGLGVHATNQLLKEKQELPSKPKQAALCHPHFPGDQERAPKKRKDFSQFQVQWLVEKPFHSSKKKTQQQLMIINNHQSSLMIINNKFNYSTEVY